MLFNGRKEKINEIIGLSNIKNKYYNENEYVEKEKIIEEKTIRYK